jgi:hypothetical protein
MNWQQKFENFEIITNWEKYNNPEKPRLKLNRYRLVKIDYKLYLEVKTQKENITFLTDLKYFEHIKNFTWTSHKIIKHNTYYIVTTIKKENQQTTLLFHRLIKSEYKMIDHINREGCDNRETNLRETTKKENQLNCRLRKTNISGFNGIGYNKNLKAWRFRWYENKKLKAKSYKVTKYRTFEQAKQEAIKFKLEHDKITGNMNGKSVKY